VKNCIGIADLLCAYADGEINETNKRLVEEHLAICDNCSAILRVYREMTVSISETNVPAPDALRIGVMNRIQSESTPRATVEKKRSNRHFQLFLTRYAPIAACLVVVLLVWQVWGSTLWSERADRMYTAAPAAAPSADMPMMTTAAESAPAPEAMWDMDGANLDDAELEEFEAAESYGADEQSMPATPQDAGGRRSDTGGTDADWLEHLYASIDGFGPLDEDEAELFINAHAIITIVGDLPVRLAMHEPEHEWQYGRFGWEMLYKIPLDDVAPLIQEALGREAFDVIYNNTDKAGNYALVLMTYGL